MAAHPHGLFEPDIIVPSQFFATLRRQAPRKGGEYRLLVAVLEDAIDCFQENAHAANKWQQRLFNEAQAWILGEGAESDADKQGPRFSFAYVCDVLGLDAAYLRWGLQQWRTRSCAIADAQHAENRHHATSCERPMRRNPCNPEQEG